MFSFDFIAHGLAVRSRVGTGTVAAHMGGRLAFYDLQTICNNVLARMQRKIKGTQKITKGLGLRLQRAGKGANLGLGPLLPTGVTG